MRDAENMVIQAENYKAEIAPEGGSLVDQIKDLLQSKADDEFFHITCHIDQNLRDKIQRGDYVDLEKLLVKNKNVKPASGKRIMKERDDGVAYFVPSEQDLKINSIHRWDQAFRVYATIYTKHNPERSSEIWQYIDSIHRAARLANWECVAQYDYTFRQLMAEYPQRNWGKTYMQMWTTMLCEGRSSTTTPVQGSKASSSHKSSWKDNTCWRFNKSRCRYGEYCRFEHRCTYCASYNHPSQSCPKKQGKRDRFDRYEHQEHRGDRGESSTGRGGNRKERRKQAKGADHEQRA